MLLLAFEKKKKISEKIQYEKAQFENGDKKLEDRKPPLLTYEAELWTTTMHQSNHEMI